MCHDIFSNYLNNLGFCFFIVCLFYDYDGSCDYVHNIHSMVPMRFEWTAQTPSSRTLFQTFTVIVSLLTMPTQAWTRKPKPQGRSSQGEAQDSCLKLLERVPSSGDINWEAGSSSHGYLFSRSQERKPLRMNWEWNPIHTLRSELKKLREGESEPWMDYILKLDVMLHFSVTCSN